MIHSLIKNIYLWVNSEEAEIKCLFLAFMVIVL
jgi:hypothetical protein